MIDVTLIIGLPGSGKSTLARSLLGADGYLIDDLSQNFSRVEDFIKSGGEKVVITEVSILVNSFSVEQIKRKLHEWFGDDASITLIAFENDLEACLENVKNRKEDPPRRINCDGVFALSAFYRPESLGCRVLPVWKPSV